LREKEEILEVFDISPGMPATQEDIFKGMAALTEMLCDIRDILDISLLTDINNDESL